jgi:O-antigen/teichoic acid export membrane protein
VATFLAGQTMNTVASPKSRLDPLKALFWFSFLSFFRRATLLILLPLYLNYMSADEVAILFLVTLTAKFAGAFANLKLDAAMRTFFFDFDGDEAGLHRYLTQIFSASLLLVVVFYGLMLISGSPLFSLIFSHDEITYFPYGALAVANVCVNLALSPYFAYLKNKLLIREFIIYQTALIAGSLGTQIIFVAGFGLGVTGALFGTLLPALLALGVLAVRQPDIFTTRLDRTAIRSSLVYSLPLILFGFLYMLEARLDRYAIERYYDLSAVAMYAILVGLLGLMSALQDALDNSIRPFLFKKLGGDANAATAAVRTYSRLYILVCLFGLSAIVFVGSNLSWVTQNDDYLSLRAYLSLGATAMVPAIYTRYCSLFYAYNKKSYSLTVWMIARTTLMLALLLFLVPRYQIEGALMAILISQVLNAAAFRIDLSRLKLAVVPVFRPVAAASLFVGSIWLSKLLFFDRGPELFGFAQLVITSVFLFALNRSLFGQLAVKLPFRNNDQKPT